MKHIAALAVGSALMAPLAAFAGGVSQPVPEPVVAAPVVTVAPTTNWTGFYGGASLGYGDINTNTNIANGSGVIGGILGGYRYDFGNWVAGAEADWIEFGEAEQCCGFGGTFSVSFPNISAAMGTLKLEHVRATQPDVFVSGDMSCLMHMGGLAAKEGKPIKTLHLAQVLRDALKDRART